LECLDAVRSESGGLGIVNAANVGNDRLEKRTKDLVVVERGAVLVDFLKRLHRWPLLFSDIFLETRRAVVKLGNCGDVGVEARLEFGHAIYDGHLPKFSVRHDVTEKPLIHSWISGLLLGCAMR